MIDWKRPRYPASLFLLTRLGSEFGVSEETSLDGTGLTFEQLLDPRALVNGEQELRVVRNLLKALPHVDDLALEAGRRYHLTTHGIWGFAIASSPTLREAISVGLRYVGLTWAFCRMSVEDSGFGLRLVLDGDHLPTDVRDFFIARELASIATLGIELGANPAVGVSAALCQPPPSQTSRYEDAFGQTPRFNAEANYIEIAALALGAALPQADLHSNAMAVEQCRSLIELLDTRAGVAGQVRDLLLLRPGDMPNIEQAAASLSVSSRTLRRHLEAEGTSYRALTDGIRRRLAEELVATGEFTIEQIAHRLGYNATPAFVAAFKRWNGTSPGAYARRG